MFPLHSQHRILGRKSLFSDTHFTVKNGNTEFKILIIPLEMLSKNRIWRSLQKLELLKQNRCAGWCNETYSRNLASKYIHTPVYTVHLNDHTAVYTLTCDHKGHVF